MTVDKYEFYDPIVGEYKRGSRSTDQLNETLQTLEKSGNLANSATVRRFNKLQDFDRFKPIHDYQEEMQGAIEEVESLKGELYTRSGKNAEIVRLANDIAEEQIANAEQMEKDYQQSYNDLNETLERELNTNKEQLTKAEIDQINLRNSELQGEIKGKLLMVDDMQELLNDFDAKMTNTQYDEGLKRFMENNYYMYLERAKEIAKTEVEEHHAMTTIKNRIQQFIDNKYTPSDKAKRDLQKKMKNMSFGMIGTKRLIKQHRDKYKRQYQ